MILTQRPRICPDDERLVVHGATARALQDAGQTDDPVLHQEALAWLWVCCPDLADELHLPAPPATIDRQATHDIERFAVWA